MPVVSGTLEDSGTRGTRLQFELCPSCRTYRRDMTNTVSLSRRSVRSVVNRCRRVLRASWIQ